MRSSLMIRPAAPPDADAVVNLVRQSFRPEDLDLTIYGCGGMPEYLRREFAPPPGSSASTYLVASIKPAIAEPGILEHAIAEPAIAGFVELRAVPGGLCLNYVVTHPDWRGMGVARDLLAAALRACQPPAGSRFTLEVFEHNRNAMGWYHGMGFRNQLRKAFWRVAPNGGDRAMAGNGVPEEPVRITGIPQADERHRAFGFSSFSLDHRQRTFTIGRLGDRWFRVTDGEFLHRPETLRSVKALDPGRDILFHGAEEAIPQAMRECCSPLLWSFLMERSL